MKETIKKLIKEFHKRKLLEFKEREIKIPINSKKFITLIGPRRSGKTFLMYQIISKIPDKTDPFSAESYRQKDFIGPQIDTGFRLKEFATPQKMIISVELAYMILKINQEGSESIINQLYYDGRKKLKGVDEKGGYPLFWTEAMPDEIDKSETAIMYSYQKDRTSEFDRLCKKYIADKDNKLHLTFIEDDKYFKNNKPPHYPEKLKEAMDILEKKYQGEVAIKLENKEITGFSLFRSQHNLHKYKNVIVYGSGGVAKAIIKSLLDLKSSIMVVSRSSSRFDNFPPAWKNDLDFVIQDKFNAQMDDEVTEYSLFINATPIKIGRAHV